MNSIVMVCFPMVGFGHSTTLIIILVVIVQSSVGLRLVPHSWDSPGLIAGAFLFIGVGGFSQRLIPLLVLPWQHGEIFPPVPHPDKTP